MNSMSAAPHSPGTLAMPPVTEVPPMTTTAMEVSRYSAPTSRDEPPVKPASSAPASPPRAPHNA